MRARQLLGNGDAAADGPLRAPECACGLRAHLALGRVGRERGPRILRIGPKGLCERLELRDVQQRGVVGGMSLGRQREALDRVGEHDAGLVDGGVCLAVGVEQRLMVVAAEVADGRMQFAV